MSHFCNNESLVRSCSVSVAKCIFLFVFLLETSLLGTSFLMLFPYEVSRNELIFPYTSCLARNELVPTLTKKSASVDVIPLFISLHFLQQTYQKEKQSLSFCPPGIVGLINLTLLALKIVKEKRNDAPCM